MKTLMLTMELMALSMGEPPHAPPLRTIPDAPPIRQPSYAAFLARVQRGESLTLAVGVDSPGAVRCDDAKRFGIVDGLYTCWRDGGEAKMQRIEQSVPNVAGQLLSNTLRFDPATRYYSPVWSQSCPNGQCPKR